MLACVLHARPYRETSRLVTWLTEDQGRLDGVLRGTRSRKQSAVIPFCTYDIQWRGQHELKSLLNCESTKPPILLEKQRLYCGLYVNELLYRLLPPGVAFDGLFVLYCDTLLLLEQHPDVEFVLRSFERRLLALLGYAVDLTRDGGNGLPLDASLLYRLLPEQGVLLPAMPADVRGVDLVYPGAVFQSIAALQLEDAAVRLAAKKVMRRLIAVQLGGRPLRSRQFFESRHESDDTSASVE